MINNTHKSIRRISGVAVLAIAMIAMIIQSCSKNETKISTANGNESHNAGRNCMDCHKSGGEGEGWFTAAGTAYNPIDSGIYRNAVVQLYTLPNGNGTLVSTLYGDAKGNFYTTAGIDFSNGLYPSIIGATGTTHMHALITQGACNSCHGVTQTRIIAN
jgi:hypothetical protein